MVKVVVTNQIHLLLAARYLPYFGQLNANILAVGSALALGVALLALFTTQTAALPLTARNVALSRICPTLTSTWDGTSYISYPLSPCHSAKSVPTCSENANPLLFKDTGDVSVSLYSGCMST